MLSYAGTAPGCHPLWPSSEGFEIGTFEFRLPRKASNTELYWVPWRCFTEGMIETRGVSFIVRDDQFAYVGSFDPDEASWAGELEGEKFEQLKEHFGV